MPPAGTVGRQRPGCMSASTGHWPPVTDVRPSALTSSVAGVLVTVAGNVSAVRQSVDGLCWDWWEGHDYDESSHRSCLGWRTAPHMLPRWTTYNRSHPMVPPCKAVTQCHSDMHALHNHCTVTALRLLNAHALQYCFWTLGIQCIHITTLV